MGKKTKQGKDRLDKYYHLAKDQGYRARSAFKLIQLAKKHDFLSKSKVCIDLCAAPGGWSQVAQRNMPGGSKIIAIDLAPIKAIHGVTCIQSDITSDKCRSLIRKELQGARADVVLHDGAPNVGSTWTKDAYGQAELTLHALRLACEQLRAGGTFVTKVFRSSDYNSLLWVFNQLFSKVDATKPTASRNVSAEIFVLCIGFKAGKIDPKFFDPKSVFMESLSPADDQKMAGGSGKGPSASLSDYLKNQKKRHRGGYEPGDDLRIIAAHDYVASTNPAEVLMTHHRINLEASGSEELAGHPLTTTEIREHCADVKVLGKKDLGTLLKWRMKIIRERERAERKAKKADGNGTGAASSAGPKKGESGAGGTPVDAATALARDVDDAIAELLQEGGGASAGAGGEGGEDCEDEALEKELAEQVDKRRREERRDAKKTMARQKKQEWRKKMSLGGAKSLQDMPELFRASERNVKALEDQDLYVDPIALDSGREDSDAEAEDSESDSDEGLDRLARLEVDLAVNHELRKLRDEDKFRTSMQRLRKRKKETRRERVAAAWSGELGAFSEAIDQRAASERALRDKDDDGEGDDDDDDDDSDGDLQVLRDFQRASSGPLENGDAPGGLDGDALLASLEGPPRTMPASARGRERVAGGPADEDEEEGDPADLDRGDAAMSGALVPVEDDGAAGTEALRAEHRMARWFSQDIFRGAGAGSGSEPDRGSEDGSDVEGPGSRIREVDDSRLPKLPLTDKEKRRQKRKRDTEWLEKQGKKPKKDKEKDEDKGPVEVAPLELPRPLVPIGPQKPTDPKELAETLALGSILVESKKSRMELIDAAYNRWTFDADEGLPDWFTEEENKYNKPELPISKELMDQFRAKLREINARPIRKVAEAKARKKRRLNKRLQKLRSTAMSLVDTPDVTEAAKARQMRKAVNKMARQDERKVSVVAVKKGGGGKRTEKGGKVPKGAKVKVVDKRMKSDRRGEKKAAKRNKSRSKAMVRKNGIKQQKKAAGRRGGSGGGGKGGGGKGGGGGKQRGGKGA